MRMSAEVKHRNMKSRDVGRRKAQQPRRVQEKLCPWETDVARVFVKAAMLRENWKVTSAAVFSAC